MKSKRLFCFAAGALISLAQLSALPALTAPGPYWSCSWSGSIGLKDPKASRGAIGFAGFMHERPGPLGSAWLMRGNISDGGGQARWQGVCDKDRYCWIEQKYASGKRRHYSIWIGAQREQNGVRSTHYEGSWGSVQNAGSHPIWVDSVCKPVAAASPAAFESIVTKSLGWAISAF